MAGRLLLDVTSPTNPAPRCGKKTARNLSILGQNDEIETGLVNIQARLVEIAAGLEKIEAGPGRSRLGW